MTSCVCRHPGTQVSIAWVNPSNLCFGCCDSSAVLFCYSYFFIYTIYACPLTFLLVSHAPPSIFIPHQRDKYTHAHTVSYFPTHFFPPSPPHCLCIQVTMICTSDHLPLMKALDWVETFGNFIDKWHLSLDRRASGVPNDQSCLYLATQRFSTWSFVMSVH